MTSEWNAPVEITAPEAEVLKLCKKQKLWRFLRTHRHRLLDGEVRSALRAMYANDPRGGHPPVAPERLALAMLLQVAFQVADHEVPTLTAVDRRWQVVLDLLGHTRPAFSQGTVFNFRERARASGLMRMLLEKTMDLARTTKGFSQKRLRAIFDSSPLVGAGRVEDTFNLLGRAIAQLVEVAASEGPFDAEAVAREADVPVFSSKSVKAVLDVDWREPNARSAALHALLDQFERLQRWLAAHFEPEQLARPPLSEHIETVSKIVDQDVEPDPDDPGSFRIRRGTSKDRLISLSDPDMRHGRKSSAKAFNGYKRHIVVDADVQGLICGVELLPANASEQEAAGPLLSAIEGSELGEIHIDRGYLPAPEIVAQHEAGVTVISKPPTSPQSDFFSKADFELDFTQMTVTCPGDITIELRLGKTLRFPPASCRSCDLRSQCTKSRKSGRQLRIHPQEEWYRDMADELATPEGRQRRRERIPVEHALARVSSIQGNRARFRGLAKNLFDLERTAVVNNCFVLDTLWPAAA